MAGQSDSQKLAAGKILKKALNKPKSTRVSDRLAHRESANISTPKFTTSHLNHSPNLSIRSKNTRTRGSKTKKFKHDHVLGLIQILKENINKLEAISKSSHPKHQNTMQFWQQIAHKLNRLDLDCYIVVLRTGKHIYLDLYYKLWSRH